MRRIRPSQTSRGSTWLENFATSDRSAAALLIDTLDVVGSDDMRVGLLDHLAALDKKKQPTVLIPVLAQEDISARAPFRKQIAYETFSPGSRIASTPGSEAFVGNVIRDLTGERPGSEKGTWLHPASSIEVLRRSKCRRMFLVTDYCGSGEQVVEFARMFVRNATIRSWRSFGWLKISVVTYAMSKEARERIEKESSIDDYSVVRPAASFPNAPWTDGERQAIVEVCTNYLLTHERKRAFGFKDSAGLFVMHSRVPNNIPLLLRRRRHGWHPFFEGRRVPGDLISELGSYRSERDLAKITRAANQSRISSAIESGRLRSPTDKLAAILALLAYRQRSPSDLAHVLNESVKRIEDLLAFLMSSKLISPQNRLTAAGKRELNAAKRLSRVTTARLEGNDAPYYPQHLR